MCTLRALSIIMKQSNLRVSLLRTHFNGHPVCVYAGNYRLEPCQFVLRLSISPLLTIFFLPSCVSRFHPRSRPVVPTFGWVIPQVPPLVVSCRSATRFRLLLSRNLGVGRSRPIFTLPFIGVSCSRRAGAGVMQHTSATQSICCPVSSAILLAVWCV